jgi:hypothetical protein
MVNQRTGPKINTEGRDISFLNDEHELYFASDGHPDWRTRCVCFKINSDNSFNEVQNLGSDINSQRTILHIIDTKSRMGFFLVLIVMVVKDMMIFIIFRN